MLSGVLPPYRAGVVADAEWMTAFARSAEAAGMESLYLVEHVAVASGYDAAYPYSDSGRMPLAEDCPVPDPLELTAFLAARTSTLRFGTGVLVAPHHHPLVLAKRLATLDVLSGGRVSAGFGVGWMREEVESTGGDFTTRGRRTDELLASLRAALEEDPATFEGEFFSFSAMRVHPRPTGSITLHVGGHSAAAARRAGRFAEGLHPLGLDADTLADRWNTARRAAEEAGRDPAALELSVTLALPRVADASTVAEAVQRHAALGVHRIVWSSATTDPAELADAMAAAATACRSAA